MSKALAEIEAAEANAGGEPCLMEKGEEGC